VQQNRPLATICSSIRCSKYSSPSDDEKPIFPFSVGSNWQDAFESMVAFNTNPPKRLQKGKMSDAPRTRPRRKRPRPGAVYNIGGSHHSNCWILKAIDLIRDVSGHQVMYRVSEHPRSGDHIWWVSDVRRWQRDFPGWSYTYDLRAALLELIEAASERYATG
jgi:hypothetical protein